MSTTCETLVVGAGFSGLAYAQRRGPGACRVLEASGRVGGLVNTLRAEAPVPLRYEAGPETISDPSGSTEAFARALGVGITRAPEGAGKRFVVAGGRLREVPLSPPGILFGSLLSPLARLRLLTEPLRSGGRGLDGSLADFVRHRLGSEVLEKLVDPMIAGIHACGPEELSLRAAFPDLADGVERHGSILAFMKARAAARKAERAGAPRGPRRAPLWKPAGGMQRLCETLAAGIGEHLHLDTRVRRLRPLQGSALAGDARWEVETEDRTWRAERVVLALPLAGARELLSEAAPAAAAALEAAPRESLVVHVHAYRREDVGHPLDGFGYLVPRREGLAHLGTLFSSSFDPECVPEGFVLLRTMLGGSRHPELASADRGRFDTIRREEVRPLLDLRAEPVFQDVIPYSAVMPRYDAQHVARRERLLGALPTGLSILGNYLHGIGLSALLARAHALADEHERAFAAASAG